MDYLSEGDMPPSKPYDPKKSRSKSRKVAPFYSDATASTPASKNSKSSKSRSSSPHPSKTSRTPSKDPQASSEASKQQKTGSSAHKSVPEGSQIRPSSSGSIGPSSASAAVSQQEMTRPSPPGPAQSQPKTPSKMKESSSASQKQPEASKASPGHSSPSSGPPAHPQPPKRDEGKQPQVPSAPSSRASSPDPFHHPREPQKVPPAGKQVASPAQHDPVKPRSSSPLRTVATSSTTPQAPAPPLAKAPTASVPLVSKASHAPTPSTQPSRPPTTPPKQQTPTGPTPTPPVVKSPPTKITPTTAKPSTATASYSLLNVSPTDAAKLDADFVLALHALHMGTQLTTENSKILDQYFDQAFHLLATERKHAPVRKDAKFQNSSIALNSPMYNAFKKIFNLKTDKNLSLCLSDSKGSGCSTPDICFFCSVKSNIYANDRPVPLRYILADIYDDLESYIRKKKIAVPALSLLNRAMPKNIKDMC